MTDHEKDDRGARLAVAGNGDGEGEMDAASQSLADALRWSFRLLSAIMLFVLVGFVLSGFRTIQPQQMGVKKVFGRVTGPPADQGLAFTWPFPIGQIEIVDVSEQALEIDDFWMHETPADKTKSMEERTAMSEGLRPGWDGALFTGDNNLLHVKLTCRYKVQDVLGYLGGVREADLSRQTTLRELIRSLVCKAAIQVASSKTADSIRSSDKEQYTRRVEAETQRQLNLLTLDPKGVAEFRRELTALPAGVDATARQQVAGAVDELLGCIDDGRIADARAQLGVLAKMLGNNDRYAGLWGRAARLVESVKILRIAFTNESWPLKARDAYVAAQRARSERIDFINQATANAKAALRGAAGDSYEKLVGKPWQIAGKGAARAPERKRVEELIGRYEAAAADANEEKASKILKKIDVDLIGRYEAARDAGDQKTAEWLLARIGDVLQDRETEGKAFRILEGAKARSDAALQPLLAWQRRFEEVLPTYRIAREVFLTREWAAAATEIFGYPSNLKLFMRPGSNPTVLRINAPPELLEKLREAGLKKAKAP